jgi:preprotein translocase subunit SecY
VEIKMPKSLINKIVLTFGILLVYRLLAYVPVPGVDISVIKEFFDNNSNNALGLVNMFSGNAISRFSIISLGIMPYITASIIIELLAATFPSLGKMKKERDGMAKYMQIIRYVTIGITIIQAIGVSVGLQSLNGSAGQGAIMIDTTTFMFVSTVAMVVGTMMLMWLGEQITQRGIGNGISLIIFAGIVSAIPSAIAGTVKLLNTGELGFIEVIAILAIILVTVGVIIYIELAERRVAISYSRKVMMQNQKKRVMNYIPIKVNLSGVIPPIFASAILMFPATILQSSDNEYLKIASDVLNPSGYAFNVLTFLFVIFFSFFYASIVFNAKDIADNLKKQGGFIPGIRPGEGTKEYINGIADRLTYTGAFYLACISTIPWILVKLLGVPFYFGGTAVLIVVQVAIDTMRKIEAQIYMNKYDTLSVTGL